MSIILNRPTARNKTVGQRVDEGVHSLASKRGCRLFPLSTHPLVFRFREPEREWESEREEERGIVVSVFCSFLDFNTFIDRLRWRPGTFLKNKTEVSPFFNPFSYLGFDSIAYILFLEGFLSIVCGFWLFVGLNLF